MARFRGRAKDDQHRDGFSQRAAQPQHRRRDDTATTERQHGHPHHLPLGGSQRLRRFHLNGRGLPEHFSRYRGDDRQDHRRKDDAGGENGAAAGQGNVALLEQKQPPQVAIEKLRDRLEFGRQHEDSPQPEDDRRHRGQQINHRSERTRQPFRHVLGEEHRDPDRDRHGHYQRGYRAQRRDHEQVADAERQVFRTGGIEFGAGEEVRVVGTQRRDSANQQEYCDQQDRNDDRRTGGGGGQLEQLVAPPRLVRLSRLRRRPSLGRRTGEHPARHDTPDHAMAFTAVDNFDLNESGMGMYPLSAKPFWPAPMVLCRNALTAVPTWESGYFEQTIS